jgi:hypothetical protein
VSQRCIARTQWLRVARHRLVTEAIAVRIRSIVMVHHVIGGSAFAGRIGIATSTITTTAIMGRRHIAPTAVSIRSHAHSWPYATVVRLSHRTGLPPYDTTRPRTAVWQQKIY